MANPAGSAPQPSGDDGADITFVSLPHKPTARLAVRFISAPSASSPLDAAPTLVVFLNGLMTTSSSWTSACAQLLNLLPQGHNTSLLLYDRYGQGQSDRDPLDHVVADPSHAHNLVSSATDLSQLITKFAPSKHTRLVLVGNSIGCGLARLYAERHPSRTPAAILLLDSVLANVNMLDLFPDPDKAGFDLSGLPSNITEPNLRKTRAWMARVFDPSVGSAEGLSRRDLATLLPHSNAPTLPGRPRLTVIGHGVERFAAESEASGMDAACVRAFLQPFWEQYNAGLLEITAEATARKGPIEAVGAGHFIQRDRPDLVAMELKALLEKLSVE